MASLAQEIIDGRTQVTSEEVEYLTGMSRDLYYDLPNVVETPTENVLYVGDLHGDLGAIKTIYEIARRYKNHSLVFLGDYADRGPYQTETVNFILALGLIEPERVFILRGNHESERVAVRYGFYLDVTKKYSGQIFRKYIDAFEALPVAGLSRNGVFSCHGGVPEGVYSFEQLLELKRQKENFEDNIIMQLVWNDPIDKDVRFRNNVRGEKIRTYGRKAFDEFAHNLEINLMFRAHQVFPDGIQTFFDGRLISIFSTEYNGRVKPKVVRLGKNLQYEALPIL